METEFEGKSLKSVPDFVYNFEFGDVFKILEPGLMALDRGLMVDLNGNDVSTMLCIFTQAVLEI